MSTIDGYLLGILWGCCAVHHLHLVCRCRDSYYPDYVAAHLGGRVRVQQARTGPQYVVDLPISTDALAAYGWQPRNADERPYPHDIDDNAGFCAAWIELHHSVGVHRTKGGFPCPRLRIYGNRLLMGSIETYIAEIAGVGHKSIQQLHNVKTAGIYYQSGAEVSSICTSLIRNPFVRSQIEQIILDCKHAKWQKSKAQS